MDTIELNPSEILKKKQTLTKARIRTKLLIMVNGTAKSVKISKMS
jgi:hypothetical protein